MSEAWLVHHRNDPTVIRTNSKRSKERGFGTPVEGVPLGGWVWLPPSHILLGPAPEPESHFMDDVWLLDPQNDPTTIRKSSKRSKERGFGIPEEGVPLGGLVCLPPSHILLWANLL